MNELRQPEVPTAQADPERPFVLEAHTYSDGLRIKVLGSAPERPAWAPPPDYVGFRNEMALRPGDYVVEFARFLHREQRVTWIGLYKRAVDEVLGDRQNHGGVGLWLLDHDVLYAEPLLTTLRSFADAAVRGETLDGHADAFTIKGLPEYLQPSLALPTPMAGWPYSPSRIAESASFSAIDPDPSEAWMLAADQLLRATLLAPPTPRTARALILVRAAPTDETRGESGTTIITPLTSPELIKSLPNALRSAKSEAQESLARAAVAVELSRRRETELAAATQRDAQLEQHIAQLEAEADQLRSDLQASDPGRERAMVREELKDLSQQLSSVKTALHTVRNELLNEIGSIRRRGEGEAHRSNAQPLADLGTRPNKRPDRSRRSLALVGGIALLVLVAAAILLFWLRSSPPPTATTDPVMEYRTDLAGPAR